MELPDSNLMVIVGESPRAHELRRSFAQRGIPHAGVTSHLTGLRRALVLGVFRRVVLCLSLDDATIERHGGALRRLVADRGSFPIGLCSIGLLSDDGLTARAAGIGCDVYLGDWQAAPDTIEAMTAKPSFAAAGLDGRIGSHVLELADLPGRGGSDMCRYALPGLDSNGDTGDVSWHRWQP